MSREFDVVIEQDSEGLFVATVPAIHGCHTQAKSLDLLIERVKEAIAVCLDDPNESAGSLRFVGIQRVQIG